MHVWARKSQEDLLSTGCGLGKRFLTPLCLQCWPLHAPGPIQSLNKIYVREG